jgi:glutathione peroxidase
MKKILLFAIFTSFIGCKNQETSSKSRLLAANETKQEIMEKETIYQYKTVDLSGKPFDFATLKGKKILIVNTASKCGYTKQYADLEAIYKKYQTKNFVIVGFPANNFGAQEPGTNQEIQSFCQLNYGVTFPMMFRYVRNLSIFNTKIKKRSPRQPSAMEFPKILNQYKWRTRKGASF